MSGSAPDGMPSAPVGPSGAVGQSSAVGQSGETGTSRPVGESSAEPAWERLSPWSLLLRGGVVVVAILGWLISTLFNDFIRGLSIGSEWFEGAPPDVQDAGVQGAIAHPLFALGLLVAVVAAAVAASALNWRFTRFRITPTQVELRRGWVFRQQRQVPMDRVQAVEIGRPILAQILGLAQVVVQSAGGGHAHVTLAYLPLARAHEVRDRIQRAAAVGGVSATQSTTETAVAPALANQTGATVPAGMGQPAGATATAGGPDSGIPVLAVPNIRLVLGTLLHGSVAFLLLLAAGWVALTTGLVGQRWGMVLAIGVGLPGLVPIALAIVANRVSQVLNHGNFRLTDHGRAVRVLHGLTNHRTTTIPLERIQALEITQPLWWRPMGWWRARVNVAGVHGDADNPTNETVVLPVGALDQALAVLTLLDPALRDAELREAALGPGGEAGWVTTARSARWLDPLAWRRAGYAASRHGLLLRSGRLARRVVAVPHARIQSLTLAQGPLDRALGVTDIHVISTPGPVSPRVHHLSVPDAQAFLAEESIRAAAARSLPQGPCASGPASAGLVS